MSLDISDDPRSLLASLGPGFFGLPRLPGQTNQKYKNFEFIIITAIARAITHVTPTILKDVPKESFDNSYKVSERTEQNSGSWLDFRDLRALDADSTH